MKTYTKSNRTTAPSKKHWLSNGLKRLTHVSPFVLLLVPVLMMMTISFAFDTPSQDASAAKNSSAKSSTSLFKVSLNLFK